MENIQLNFKELLHNCKRLPSPTFQIMQVYQRYLAVNEFNDPDGKLKDRILKVNEESVVKQFGSNLQGIFFDLDRIIPEIKYRSDVSKLDKIVHKNTTKIALAKSKIKSQIKKSSQINNETPNPDNQVLSQSQKSDFILNYLFDRLHLLIADYKNHYQLENGEKLQNEMVLSFCNYFEENQYSLLKQMDQESEKIENNRFCQIPENQKLKQPGNKKTESKEQEKSALLEKILDEVVQKAESAELIQVKQNKMELQKQEKQKPQIKFNYMNIFSTAYTAVESFVQKKSLSKSLAGLFNYARDKSIKEGVKYLENEQQEKAEQEMTMKLVNEIFKMHLKHNVSKESGLIPDEFRLIEQYLHENKSTDSRHLHFLFTQAQKQVLTEVLLDEINILKSDQNKYRSIIPEIQGFFNEFLSVEVKKFKQSSKISQKKGLKTTLSTINTIVDLPNVFYLLAALYQKIEKRYSPQVRQILIRICHQIQQRYKKMIEEGQECRKFCLVHALKLLQSRSIVRSEIGEIITNQKPFRESELPLNNQKQGYFQENKTKIPIDDAQLHLEHKLNYINLFTYKKKFEKLPQLNLLKLTHSKNKKTVTFLISGFLSEDTNKFQQWMGILQPTYDSEIYALKWESHNIEKMLEYSINALKDIALAGLGVGLIGGPFFKAAAVLKQIITKYNQNPFNPCFEIATTTGIFLAQLIMDLFDGHFINLVGFSLGTQVIASALETFKLRGKLHMVNRVVTMGGVADKIHLSQVLNNAEQNNQNPISISWTNVYCQTDNILKYLLKVSMPDVIPIGLSEWKSDQFIKQNETTKNQTSLKVYEIDNINVTTFVTGHLSYRCNMKTIARLIGIKDQ